LAGLKAKNSLLFSLAIGLLVLLSVISFAVIGLAPRVLLPPSWILTGHLSLLYVIDAKVMARRLLPDPSAHWDKAGETCFPMADGVWRARGTVEMKNENGEPVSSRWEVFFVPGKDAPLFAKVGAIRWGDPGAVPRMAGDSNVPDGDADHAAK
jgi:hypothetical protein